MEKRCHHSLGKQIGDEVKKLERAVEGQLDNARITAEIKSAILMVIPYTGLEVDVDTDHGVVHLRGEVESEWQKQEAEQVARAICPKGVTRIVNELQVNPNLIPPFPV